MREIVAHLPESLTSGEVLRTNFGGLTISGKSGTGKTTAMEILASFYGIKRVKKGGQDMREVTDVHEKRPQRLDKDLDKDQVELIKTANPDDPFIDEGRLAGFLASKELERHPELDVIRVLFVASVNVRINRLLSRRIKDDEARKAEIEEELEQLYLDNGDASYVHKLLTEQIELDEKISGYTFQSVKRDEQKREDIDDAQWKKVHPELEQIDDIFNPALAEYVIIPGHPEIINGKGPKFYDFAINTNNLSVLETAIEVDNQLRSLEKVKQVSKAKLSRETPIFKA